uniref:ATP-dependent DNA helicase n=1 Tax=Heligmosomoides polygyrus TaxID=6339 RepID=A0A8L8KIB6_HELPZ
MNKSYAERVLFIPAARTGTFNPLLHAGKLSQQYIVDSWLKIEMNRLNYLRKNQKELRLDTVRGLHDYMIGDDSHDVPPGRRIILAASLTGDPRHMITQYQDAMSFVSKYGKPDIFRTFTCNPNWREIQNYLAGGQFASEWSDLVARVFNLRLKALCHGLFKRNVIGEVAAYIYKLNIADQIDQLIGAELPDPDSDPELFDIVSKKTIHRPCGNLNPTSPYMRDGVCTKRIPKSSRSDKSLNLDGYPEYRRSDDGRYVTCRGVRMDNRSVVPYCLYLTRMFETHNNAEICALFHAVKHLFKHVYKGPDRARIHIYQLNNDAAETRLQVHLPGFETLTFEAGAEQQALNAAQNRLSSLTGFFAINKTCNDLAQQYGRLPEGMMDSRSFHYHEMPQAFEFKKEWKQRKKHIRTLGRMHFIGPQKQERFALRLLLLYGKGFTSFEDSRTVEGTLYPSFASAAKAAGHLRDDTFFVQSIQEAASFHMPAQLRDYFVALIILGKDYRSYFDVDIAQLDHSEDQVDYEDYRRKGQANYNLLNNVQKLVVNDELEQCFFIDGPSGSGKAFVYTTVYHMATARKKQILNVAWTGIAANLLPDDRTASPAFRLVLEDLSRTSSIKRQSEEASKIDVIIWDEAPMAPKQALEAVNALLQDIMQNSKPFGGKIMLLGGEFRQMLPVIEKGSRYDIVQACLKTSSVWQLFKVYKLTADMRLQANDHEYREWLMKMGNGEAISDENRRYSNTTSSDL